MSQNRKDLQTHVARIRQILEKVLDQNISLPEKIIIVIRKQIITILLGLSAFLAGIATTVLSIIGDFGRGGGTGGSPPKYKGVLKK